jgi:hypothetical protein
LIEALLIELMKFTDTREISAILEELKEIKSGSENSFTSAEPKTPAQFTPDEKTTVTAVYSSPDKPVSQPNQNRLKPKSRK